MLHRFSSAVAAFMILSSTAMAATEAELDRLFAAIGMPEMIGVMQIEGSEQAEDIRSSMFPDRTAGWAPIVNAVYSSERMAQTFRAEFDAALADDDVTPLLDFFESELGKRIIDLEVTARTALLDSDAERAAEAAAQAMPESNPERYQLLIKFVEENDLVEQNVSGGLNSSLAFYQGLAAGGGFEMTEGEMLAEVWEQEPDIREESESWLYMYFGMAYDPLSDAELNLYIDLSQTDAGRDLNRSLFAGFNAMFDEISFRLGAAASQFALSEDL